MDYTAQRGCMQKSVQPFFVSIVLAFPYAVDVAAVAYWFILCVGYVAKCPHGAEIQVFMYIPTVQIRENSAIVYQYWSGARRSHVSELSALNLSVAKYTGRVTSFAERNIRRAVDLLLQASPKRVIFNPVLGMFHGFRLGFVTLTVSDQVLRPHCEVYKKCLRPFLDWLRKRRCLYIWKVELQERGQVHYHLTVNSFIHYQDIQNKWNRLQHKAGYLDGFAKVHRHYKPNSTDVHSVRNIADIEAYLVKYICKAEKNGTVGSGKVWGCSASLEGKRFSIEVDSSISSKLSKVSSRKELAECVIFKIKGAGLLSGYSKTQYQLFINKINS